MPRTLTPLVVTVILLFTAAAQADDETPFAKGLTTISLNGSWVQPIHYSDGSITSINATWGKYLWDNASLSLDLQGSFAEQPHGQEDVWIGLVGLYGRLHLLRFDRWGVFFDGGGGFSYAEDQFPTTRDDGDFSGTHFNFYGKVGFGGSYQLSGHEFLTAGVRYYHMSNGQIHGKDQNPAYDGLQYWVGMMWTR